jgi:methylenetetrahydrofolate reductase (NADPH)
MMCRGKHTKEGTDMRVTELLKAKDGPLMSFEFLPPRSDEAARKLDKVIDDVAALGPDFVTVTFKAGGATKDVSYRLAEKLKNDMGLPTVAYIAGIGLGPDDICSVLDAYRELGIETIFVIRGDEPEGDQDSQPHPECMAYASDMVSFINERYDFCLGAAGYPEGHVDCKSKEHDLECLKLKVDNGAQYVVAQYAYDTSLFFDFVKRARKIGINVPILPGIMPIYTEKMTRNLSRLCGVSLTDDINQCLADLTPDDKQAVLDFGIDLAVEQCRQYLKGGVPGLQFYTMNRGGSVVEAVKRLRKEGAL